MVALQGDERSLGNSFGNWIIESCDPGDLTSDIKNYVIHFALPKMCWNTITVQSFPYKSVIWSSMMPYSKACEQWDRMKYKIMSNQEYSETGGTLFYQLVLCIQ